MAWSKRNYSTTQTGPTPRSRRAGVWGILFIALLMPLLLGVVAACGGNGDDEAESLTIYSGRSESLVGPIIEQFANATGIRRECQVCQHLPDGRHPGRGGRQHTRRRFLRPGPRRAGVRRGHASAHTPGDFWTRLPHGPALRKAVGSAFPAGPGSSYTTQRTSRQRTSPTICGASRTPSGRDASAGRPPTPLSKPWSRPCAISGVTTAPASGLRPFRPTNPQCTKRTPLPSLRRGLARLTQVSSTTTTCTASWPRRGKASPRETITSRLEGRAPS